MVAPGASHETSRVIVFIALKRGLPTFELDGVDAYWQAPEDEEVYVAPPAEYLAKLAEEGKDTNIAWRLMRQLPGRRGAGKAWTTHAAKNLTEHGGFEQCPELPQFFYNRTLDVGLELHRIRD